MRKNSAQKISAKRGGSKLFKKGGIPRRGDRAIRGGYISFPHYVVAMKSFIMTPYMAILKTVS